MKNRSKEILVGALVVVALVLAGVFARMVGLIRPWGSEIRLEVLYGFAGGVEVGSPVRVSGVKVGRVESIAFLPQAPETLTDPVNVRLTLTVSKHAAPSVRKDSKFYINMAGIIGERYIEITPGTQSSPLLASGANVRGIDPPRIDQLLSQGYGVFGRLQEMLEQNEETLTQFLTGLNGLMKDTNKFFNGPDRKKLFSLIENMNQVTLNLKDVAQGFSDPETKEMWTLLKTLLRRAYEIDKPTLKKFLQEEGIRARIF